LSEPGFTAFRRKDDVIKQIAMGGTHMNASFPSPLLRGLVVSNYIPGVSPCSTPGFSSVAPFGRSERRHGCTRADPMERRRCVGLKPGVQRSETPGFHRIQECRTPARGDGPNEPHRTRAHLEQPK
jgi:hypothetical protein